MKKGLWILTIALFSGVLVLTSAYGASGLKAGEPIKIGIIGPMDMKTGIHMMISSTMAVEKLNNAGGVRIGGSQHPVVLVKIDSDEFRNVAQAASAAERAIGANKIHFLIGGILDEAVAIIQDVAADNKIIYINTSYAVTRQHAKRLKREYDRYKYCFTSSSAGAAAIAGVHLGIIETIAEAVRKAGVERPKVAQIVGKTTPGDMIVAWTTKTFPTKGMEVVGTWRPSPTASDLRAETAAIKSSGAHIIYAAFSGSVGVVFAKQVQELKIPALVGGSPSSSFFPDQAIEYAVTMVAPAGMATKVSDQNVSFYHEFLRRSNNELCAGAAVNCYDLIMNLAQCIQKVGTLEAGALIKAMETEEYSGVVGEITYDPKDHKLVYLKGYRAVYGAQRLPGGKDAIVWPTENSAVEAQPVQIPQWMIDAWKQ